MDKLSLMLRKRYIFALTLIALLVIVSNLGTQTFIEKQIHDSRIINLAGKQRMLSQKITKIVYQLSFANSELQEHEMLAELENSIALWEKTHKGLQFGDSDLQLPGDNPAKVQALFDQIQDEHEDMLKATKTIVELTLNDQDQEAGIKQLRDILKEKEPVFLKGMDEIVFIYDDLARVKVEKIKLIEKLLLGLTLLTLLLEALFIFKPAEGLVNRSIRGLKTNEKNLQELFDTAPSMSLLVSEKTMAIIRMNQLSREVLAIPENDTNVHYLYNFVETRYLEPIGPFIRESERTQMTPYEVVLKNYNRDATQMIFSASRLYYHDEEVLLVNFSDITEQKKNEDLLKTLASIDEMTGLLNRRTGLVIFEKAFESAKRRKTGITTCFIDLDGLKHVNDTYGHADGDVFIKTVSRAILKTIRTEDIAFRYGGDEFVIIFNDCSHTGIELIISRIKADCAAFKEMLETPYDIDFSFGYTVWNNGPDMTIAELIEIADDKMYKDKIRKYPNKIQKR